MPDRRRFAIGVMPLLALLGVAAAILLPSGAAPAAAQSAEPAVTCFEISVGWRICVAPAPEPPPPCQGIACIEPVTGAFVHRTFATGTRIDWTHGVFVLDPETGDTEGYRAPEADDNGYHHYEPLPGGWIHIKFWTDRQPVTLLLHRATGQSWRWLSDHLWLVATSSEYLLFEEQERSSPAHVERIGRFTITNRAMDAVGHFSISVDGSSTVRSRAVFSPYGKTIALDGGWDTVYLVPVATAQPTVLFKAEATDDQAGVWLAWRYEGPHIRIIAKYETASGDSRWEQHDFSWEGAPLPEPACQGQISPDGRYVASLVGGHVYATHGFETARADPWPSVVIADAASCAPLFRVQSAYTYELLWDAAWLPSSDGFVIGVHDGYMILQVRPTPDLVRLPGKNARLANLAGGGIGGEAASMEGPEPAPTGDGRYFGYGPSVYDAVEDRWVGPEVGDPNRYWWRWGDSHRDRWFGLFNESHGSSIWLLLPPVIEYPPFSDVIAFRVTGTGSCLRLRAAPEVASEIIGCLPDGARLVLTEPTEPLPVLTGDYYLGPFQPHPAVTWMYAYTYPESSPRLTWVHVRTEHGAEGWVSHDYLEHDIARCLPRARTGARSNDAADLDLPDCGLPSTTLTYGAPVTTGAVTDDGDYAFLTDPDDLTSAITTYDGLRDGLRKGNPIGLVLHQNDGDGTSQEAFYDLVEEGDLVEWREAADCWVRYHVDEVHADPRGYPPRTLLTIQVYSYAFTGCTSGPITTTGTRTFTWTPETIRTGNITVPFYHGSSLIAPEGWTGPLPDRERVALIAPAWPPNPLPAPDLGPGWSGSVSAGGGDDGYALFVWYRHESGGELDGIIQRLPIWPRHIFFHTNTPAVNQGIYEWILIDGRPAEVVLRWRHDSEGAPRESVGVSFYDAATGVDYWIGNGYQPPFSDPEVMVELARQFLPDAHPSACLPRASAGGRSNDVADLGLEDCGLPVLTLGYVAPSTTGAITDDGDYAFLSDPNDLTSAITTYEGLHDGLREGNPIGLVLHQNDDRGISQAAFYDLVQVGDLVQWWPARRCWVRYQVTEVHPDPPGTPPRKLLTIQVYSYAAADWCSGVLPPPDDHERQLFIWE